MSSAPKFSALRPMKAPTQTCDPKALTYPVLASPKIDGFRALGVSGEIVSSSLDLFRNEHLNSIMRHPSLHGLDGELVCGNPFGHDVHRRTSSGITSREGCPDFTWWLFDDFAFEAPFHQRFRGLEARIKPLGKSIGRFVQVVQHHLCESMQELLELEELLVSMGYEGAMVRDPQGPYKFGRCTVGQGWVRKLKRFVDAEFLVTGIEPAMANGNDARRLANGAVRRSTAKAGLTAKPQVGVLLGTDLQTGRALRVGAGTMTKEEAEMYMAKPRLIVGQVATYKSFRQGRNGAPSFPTFKCLRPKGT